jgi:hypothetical protein
MKRQFLCRYRQAQTLDGPKPRVVFKVGSDHARRGVMLDYGTSSLANFVAELAEAEGGTFRSIIIVTCEGRPTDAKGCGAGDRPWIRAFSRVARYRWSLFDLRRLRERLSESKLDWRLREIVSGHDYLLLVGHSQPATF